MLRSDTAWTIAVFSGPDRAEWGSVMDLSGTASSKSNVGIASLSSGPMWEKASGGLGIEFWGARRTQFVAVVGDSD
jgi:hypothetical protein